MRALHRFAATVVAPLAIALLAAAPAAAQPAPPASPEEKTAAVVRPAIVFIQVDWHGWVRDRRTGELFGGAAGYEATTTCTGTVIREDGYVVTAGHCVDSSPIGGGGALVARAVQDLAKAGRVRDPESAVAQLADNAVLEGATGGPIDRRIQVERATGSADAGVRDIAPAKIVDSLAPLEGDIAVLKIPRTHLPAVEIMSGATKADPPSGSPILAIGYPGSPTKVTDPTLEPSVKNGQVSNHRTQNGHPFLEISAAITQGMSGGPVVDLNGQIVGVISQLSPDETQAFNLASAATTLTDVLRDKDIRPALSPTDRNYRAGLEEYFTGENDTAIDYFDAVLEDVPSHQQAKEYRDRAAQRGGEPTTDPTTLLLIIGGCVALAVLASVTGAILLTRRRTAPTPYAFPPPTPMPAPPSPPTPSPDSPTAAASAEPASVTSTEAPTAVTSDVTSEDPPTDVASAKKPTTEAPNEPPPAETSDQPSQATEPI